MFTPNGFDEDKHFDSDGSGSGESVIVSGWPEFEECRKTTAEEWIYQAAVSVAVAELRKTRPEIVQSKRDNLEMTVKLYGPQTW